MKIFQEKKIKKNIERAGPHDVYLSPSPNLNFKGLASFESSLSLTNFYFYFYYYYYYYFDHSNSQE